MANKFQVLDDIIASLKDMASMSDEDKREIADYISLKKEEDYEINEFVTSVERLKPWQILQFFHITQRHLFESPKFDDYVPKLQDLVSTIYTKTPFPHDTKYFDVLEKSANAGNSPIGLCILTDHMAKQMGVIESTRNDTYFHPRVSGENIELYLELASRLAEKNGINDTEILRQFPKMIEHSGVNAIKQRVPIIPLVTDEEYGDINSVLSYVGILAGDKFFVNSNDSQRIFHEVESRYFPSKV